MLEAKAFAMKNGLDTMIVDTAGRLHINDEMVEELAARKSCLTRKKRCLCLMQ
jgi:signal recognition particle subunit SRP54